MPREFGQRLNPSWDALRAKTIFGAAVSDTSGGVSGGLTNQIVVWHANGGPLAFFSATEAGLITALTVAAYGDTVTIPSVTIQLSAGLTLPAGVALVGMGENSVLSFGGFAGTAITMAAWAIVYNLGVKFLGSGTDLIGIDAQFTSTVIAPCFVLVSGGSVSNIGVIMGA